MGLGGCQGRIPGEMDIQKGLRQVQGGRAHHEETRQCLGGTSGLHLLEGTLDTAGTSHSALLGFKFYWGKRRIEEE